MSARNILNIGIDELELSIRAFNGLKREGILTLRDLTAKSESELWRISNFGRGTIKEVKGILHSFGLELRPHGAPVLTIEEQMIGALTHARAAKQKYEDAMADVQRLAKLLVDAPATLEDHHD